MKILAKSEKETINFAAKFAKSIKKPAIILLEGDLGAGKTHFVKGIAKGMKCKAVVTSPTFTIMNLYEGGRMPIYHFDMYRLNGSQEAEILGFEEYFDRRELRGVTVVEWAGNVPELTQDYDYKVNITKLEDDSLRLIEVLSERR